MAMRNSFSVTVAGGILLVLGFLMSFEWIFGVVFELVVGTDKLFGAVADKLPVAAVDKLEINILVVDRLVAVSLAGKCCGKYAFLAVMTDWVMMMMMMLMDMADFGNDSCFQNYCIVVLGCFKISGVGNGGWEINWMHWTYLLKDATVQSSNKLVQDLWRCKVISLDCLNLVQISMEASQVSSDCFYVFLFDGSKCVSQVIDTIVITKVF
ncbi:hypothetical protein G9A89_006955 [Geosiphon pyriformis]|nr:hypothetical protein G9A89_006955 [Geosiphon pyriformis]